MHEVLILDNYDSFTWNLVQAVESLGAHCVVRRSDRIAIEEVQEMAPPRIILSPGPFGPERTGICADVVRRLSERIPVLGVCLGMQVIATVGGAVASPSTGRPRRCATPVAECCEASRARFWPRAIIPCRWIRDRSPTHWR